MSDVTTAPTDDSGNEAVNPIVAALKIADDQIRNAAAMTSFLSALGVAPGEFLLEDVQAEGDLIQFEYPGVGIDMVSEYTRMVEEAPELLATLGVTRLEETPMVKVVTGVDGYMMNYGQAVEFYEALGKALGKS